jgi:uncharacterized protein YbjT (DUF2867 family)
MRILVTGGSGRLGTELVRRAVGEGHDVRVSSRRPRPASSEVEWVQADLRSGEDVARAVDGVEAIVHLASDPRPFATVDVEGSRRLGAAARRAGVERLILVSIVGIDRIPLPYYQAKLGAEEVVRQSGVPYSILRAAQFHDFVDLLLGKAARVPKVLPVPAGFQIQSIGTGDVAEKLLEVVISSPGGRLPDLFGPEAMPLARAARTWVRARGLQKRVVEVPIRGRSAAAFRKGFNTAPHRPGGRETWEDWLKRTHSPKKEGRDASH